jgi:hypothetical protein
MLDFIMIGIFIFLPITMVGLTNFSSSVIDQGSEEKL